MLRKSELEVCVHVWACMTQMTRAREVDRRCVFACERCAAGGLEVAITHSLHMSHHLNDDVGCSKMLRLCLSLRRCTERWRWPHFLTLETRQTALLRETLSFRIGCISRVLIIKLWPSKWHTPVVMFDEDSECCVESICTSHTVNRLIPHSSRVALEVQARVGQRL